MFVNTLFRRICFISFGLAIILAIKVYLFSPIYYAESVIFPYAITPFNKISLFFTLSILVKTKILLHIIFFFICTNLFEFNL